MLESLFHTLASLTVTQGIVIFFIVALFLSIIPYWSLLEDFLKHLIYPKPLSIKYFRYDFFQINKKDYQENNYPPLPNYLIDGSLLVLSWKVSGAWRIDITPLGKNIKGNSASIIFNSDSRKYVLTAYGFFCTPVTSTLEIPLSSTYHLEKTKINRAFIENKKISPVLRITTLKNPFSIFRHSIKFPLKNINRLYKKMGLNTIISNSKTNKLNNQLSENKIMRFYSFSTKKYPNSVH